MFFSVLFSLAKATLRKKVSILVTQLFNDLHKKVLVMAKEGEGIG